MADTEHQVEVPAAGVNIDLEEGTYEVSGLSTFGPWYKVDAPGSVDATVDAFFTAVAKPEKLPGVGEKHPDFPPILTIVVPPATTTRLAMRALAADFSGGLGADVLNELPGGYGNHFGAGATAEVRKSVFVKITSPIPFDI